MLTRTISRTNDLKRKQSQTQSTSGHLSRLLAAAVINKGFRELLLSDPARALAQGYYGEEFPLDRDQKALILSVRADNLRDFALQITTAPAKETAAYAPEWIPVKQPVYVLNAK